MKFKVGQIYKSCKNEYLDYILKVTLEGEMTDNDDDILIRSYSFSEKTIFQDSDTSKNTKLEYKLLTNIFCE